MAEYPRTSDRLAGRLKKSGLRSKIKMFFITAVIVFAIISFFGGEFGFFRLWILSKKIEKLERNIQVLQVERQDLLWETDKMKNDPAYIQKYAVQTYGYARPDQKVIQFVQVASRDSASPQTAETKQAKNPKGKGRK